MGVCCQYCEKLFSKQSNLNRHIKNVHKLKTSAVSYDKSVWNCKCMESNCNSSFERNEDLIFHLKADHNKKFEIEDILFTSKKEFADWKMLVEEKYNCNYIMSAKKNNSQTSGTIYYKCNRSRTNKWILTQERQRNLKSQGSCKLDFTCTSQIKVKYELNEFCVHFIKTHYNHEEELQHIRLSRKAKNEVAAKLISGLTDQRVLETTREKIREQLTRIDLLTSKDVDNIKVKFNIEAKRGKRHPNDAVSVDIWVKDCQSKPADENMVLFYKRQDEDSSDLRKTDFCLIIMNSFQELMFKKFGNNVIAVDSTHGLNNYDFEMSTVMIIDDFGEGVPVALMFSNRKDTYIYQLFFKTILLRIGKVTPKTFMSDLAEHLYNAWCGIMGPVLYHLYCSWHVDRAWQTNLTKIKTKEKQVEVYQTLKVLQSEMNEVEFNTKLISAIRYMLEDIDTESFGSYFQSNYVNNCRQWAYCFRKSSGINTNMRLESMHKVIKYFYLNHKKIKRLDKGLHAVLKYIKNKNVERIIKLTKGKNTIYSRDIFRRHKLALQSNFSSTLKDVNCWELSTNKGQKYLVLKHANLSCCKLTCSFCNICVHMYSCDCINFFGKLTICKHIHYIRHFVYCVQIEDNQNDRNDSLYSNLFFEKSDCVGERENISKLVSIAKNNIDLESNITNTFATLQNLDLNNLDDNIASEIHSHLNIIDGLVELNKTKSEMEAFKSVNNSFEATHKNIQQQLRFSSTKKTHKKSQSRNKKPNKKQVEQINNILVGNSQLYVSTNCSNDHSYL